MPHKNWAPGEPVVDTDFNPNVADQVAVQFASIAARSAWATPPPGALSALTPADVTAGLELYLNGVWRKPWNLPWGMVAGPQSWTTETTSNAATFVSVAGTQINWTAVANRRYRVTYQLHHYVETVGDVLRFQQINASGTAVGSPAVLDSAPTGPIKATMLILPFYETIASGPTQRTLQLQRTTGTGIVHAFVDAARPGLVMVEDCGPAGPPA
jgi:hypothetical protein